MGISGGTLVDGRYFIRDRVGAGAMGVVYRAEDVGLDRVVAIKLIDPQLFAAPGVLECFVDEARSLARVRHDHVVRIYAYGVHDEAPFFVMEHLAGATLESMISDAGARGTTLPIEESLSILRALASGLDEVHRHGLVHRDVKPANVIVTKDEGRPVLVDFGLVRAGVGSSFDRLAVGGTPMYMAPEQATDIDGTQVSRASDQYGLACIAFELLTSRPAFDGKTVYATILAHLRGPAPQTSVFRDDLERTDGVFARAFAKHASDRYGTCTDFVEALARAIVDPTPTTSVRRKRIRTLRLNAPRVFVLADEEGFGRRIVSTVERTLADAVIESFALVSDLVTAFEASGADVVILDEDASMSPLPTVCRALRGAREGSAVRIVVLRRAGGDASAELDAYSVKQLRKPVSLQVLASVLS